MRNFKETDCWISVGLILFFAVASIADSSGFLNTDLLTGYVVVGSWQIISMIVHTQKKWFTGKGSKRYIYHWISFIAVITLPLGSYYFLYFLAPFMAIYYTYICFYEVKVKMQRPLALLK